jgi:hypothetical protein
MVPRTNWPVCQVCGKPVPTESGCLAISPVIAKPGAKQENRVSWGHSACYPDSFLKIPYSEFDTIEKVVGRRIMSLDETWFNEVDWEEVVAAHYNKPAVKTGPGPTSHFQP